MYSRKVFIFSMMIIIAAMTYSCHVGRFFYYNFADAQDYKKFPALEVVKGQPGFQFIESQQTTTIALPDSFAGADGSADLNAFLDKHKTLAFIVVRNDTILSEAYFDDYTASSVIPSFSVAKTFVSALAGIAVDRGIIESVHDTIGKYLPEFRGRGFDKVSIEHLLDMRSGIRFNEGYTSPFADMAKYYYGLNLQHYLKKLKMKEAPGLAYEYISVNTLLLSLVVERAWKKDLASLLQEELWQPLGMEYDASWSIDSKKHKTVKSFCCINARTRDFARFGRLYLHQGNWDGKQLISKDWVHQSLSIRNDSRDSQGYPYSYQWRVMGNGAFFAKGVLGQFIYVNPAKKLIIVRLGKSTDKVHWPMFFEALAASL